MSDAPVLVVGIGDVKVGKMPSLIRTNLGSCIGVCLYNDAQKIGGMLHCMLPSSVDYRDKPNFRAAKYADSGLDELLAELKRTYNVSPSQLKAKFFGGASMLKAITINIGGQNEQAVKNYLKSAGIHVLACKTGGEKGYQIDFDLSTGKVYCRIFGQETQEF